MKRALLALAVVGLVSGCSAAPFRVKISGEVIFAAKDAPREFKSGIYTSTEASAARQLAGGKTSPADRATVSVVFHFKGDKIVTDVVSIIPEYNVQGRFVTETKSDGFDDLEQIVVKAESPGRSVEERRFTTPKGVPFEESVLVVLEDAPLVAPPSAVATAAPKGVTPPDASSNAAQKK